MSWFKKSEEKQDDEIKLVKLITVRNTYELGIVESILKENKIPYIPKEEGVSGYLRVTTGGILFSPTIIMVEESFYQKAKELVEPLFDENNGENNEEE